MEAGIVMRPRGSAPAVGPRVAPAVGAPLPSGSVLAIATAAASAVPRGLPAVVVLPAGVSVPVPAAAAAPAVTAAPAVAAAHVPAAMHVAVRTEDDTVPATQVSDKEQLAPNNAPQVQQAVMSFAAFVDGWPLPAIAPKIPNTKYTSRRRTCA